MLAPGVDTNLLQRAEDELKKILEKKKLAEDFLKVLDEAFEYLNQHSRILETDKRLSALLERTTNSLWIPVQIGSNTVDVIVLNPIATDAKGARLRGSFHILYPNHWRSEEITSIRDMNPYAAYRSIAKMSEGQHTFTFEIDTSKPWRTLSKEDQEKEICPQLESLTTMPLEEIILESAVDEAPEWIPVPHTLPSQKKNK